MKKYITKTADEIQLENDKFEQDHSCPNCGRKENFCSYIRKFKGVFTRKSRKIYHYNCSQCGCNYTVEGDWEKL